MRNFEFTRRGLIRAVPTAALASGVLASRAARAASPLVVTDPGGEWHTAANLAFYAPFQKASGMVVRSGSRPSLALGQIKAMVDSHNVQWDVTDLSDYLTYRGGEAGLLEKIDYQSMDTTGMLKDAMMPYCVGVDAYATIMAYNTKKWPAGKGPKSWADFWDVKRFPGRRSMSGIGYGPLEFALLADGVPMDKIYPLDVERALKKMSEIRSHVDVWWTTGAQQAQLMRDGEVDLIQGWNARLYSGITQGAPFQLEWSQGMYQWEGWVILKGAPQAAAAKKFIEFCMRPQQQALFVEHLAYGPSNADSFKYVPKSRQDILPTFPSNLKHLFRADAKWLADNLNAVTAHWTRWRAS